MSRSPCSGGTSPLIIESILQATGNQLSPAFYMMGMSVLGAVAVWFMRESSCRPLPGSMPSVASAQEAEELVANQDDSPFLDLSELPFEALRVPDAVLALGSNAAVVPGSNAVTSAPTGAGRTTGSH